MRITSLSLAAALVPCSALAVDYMTADQARSAMFAQADHFIERDVVLDAAQMQSIQTLAGIAARSATWRVVEARRANELLGYLVVDQVVGKFELIGYAVALDPHGAVRQVEILSYRESHGGEIRLPAWRRQFVGKDAHAALRVGEDIANISGATLSCTHVTDGVRRIVAMLRVAVVTETAS